MQVKSLAIDPKEDCPWFRAEGRRGETMKETELQRLERLEREGPFTPPQYTAAERKRIEGAARQYTQKDFKPFDYSSS